MEIKVISFNIRCTDDINGHSILERAPRINQVVKPYDADVIGFQEYKPAWEEHIEKYFGDKYDLFNKYRSTEEWDIESPPILWKKDKFDCVKKGYFWLSDTPEKESKGWDTQCPCTRICLYVVLEEKASGSCFTFMNTHFGFGDDCQEKSANLICKSAKEISDYPTFVTGDFNMIPDSPGYKVMTANYVDTNGATICDRRSTYHGYNPDQYPDMHIDYCFADSSIKPTECEIIDKTVNGKYPSDHFGLYVKLDI